MEFIDSEKSIKRENSTICIATEYPTNHQKLNFAIVHVTGKYPEVGHASNQVCTEIVYVQSGQGKVTVNGVTHSLKTGDVIIIEPNEHFVWEGNLQLHIACHPAFSPEQHVIVDLQ